MNFNINIKYLILITIFTAVRVAMRTSLATTIVQQNKTPFYVAPGNPPRKLVIERKRNVGYFFY